MANRTKQRNSDSYPDYEVLDPADIDAGPDVMLDVPIVEVEEIDLEVDDLRAGVSVRAELRDLVKLNVGVSARLGKAELNIKGVKAQALLKARLDNVSLIIGRVLTSLDRNPALLESVGRSIEEAGRGGHQILESTGETTEDLGGAVGETVEGLGRQARKGVGG